jgi:hypothetical protein
MSEHSDQCGGREPADPQIAIAIACKAPLCTIFTYKTLCLCCTTLQRTASRLSLDAWVRCVNVVCLCCWCCWCEERPAHGASCQGTISSGQHTGFQAILPLAPNPSALSILQLFGAGIRIISVCVAWLLRVSQSGYGPTPVQPHWHHSLANRMQFS